MVDVRKQVFRALFQKPCFGDPRQYLVNNCRQSCTQVEREKCYETCYKRTIQDEENFRQKHGHDHRFAVVVYNENKGKKGWGYDHDKWKG